MNDLLRDALPLERKNDRQEAAAPEQSIFLERIRRAGGHWLCGARLPGRFL